MSPSISPPSVQRKIFPKFVGMLVICICAVCTLLLQHSELFMRRASSLLFQNIACNNPDSTLLPCSDNQIEKEPNALQQGRGDSGSERSPSEGVLRLCRRSKTAFRCILRVRGSPGLHHSCDAFRVGMGLDPLDDQGGVCPETGHLRMPVLSAEKDFLQGTDKELSGLAADKARLKYGFALPTRYANGSVTDAFTPHKHFVHLHLETIPGLGFKERVMTNLAEKQNSPYNTHLWFQPNIDIWTGTKQYEEAEMVICINRLCTELVMQLRTREKHKYCIFDTPFTSTDVQQQYRRLVADKQQLNLDVAPLPEKNWTEALHVAGKSDRKGTQYLLDAWAQHPEWPKLTVIISPDLRKFLDQQFDTAAAFESKVLSAKNIEFIWSKIPEVDLRRMQLSIGLHICPSIIEGYGHYINEARSAGAVILTTNGAPMDELVKDGINGFLIGSEPQKYQYGPFFPQAWRPTYEGFVTALDRYFKTTEEEKIRMGKNSRKMYEKEREELKKRAGTLFSRTCEMDYELGDKASSWNICKDPMLAPYIV